MEKSSRERRRSRRLSVQIPSVIRGTDMADRVFFDRAETVSIDQFGARIRTRFRLTSGTRIELELPTEENQKLMRVVWCGEPGTVLEGVVGVEFADAGESWSASTLRMR